MVSYRQVHNILSFVISIPILVAAVTGAIWTIDKHWYGVKPPTWLMKWHQGDHWFGLLAPTDATFFVDDGSGPLPQLPLTRHWRYQYFWAVGLTAVLHFGSGVAMMNAPWSSKMKMQRGTRLIHHLVAITLGWPVMFTVMTGVAYRLLRMHDVEGVKWLRVVHTGYFDIMKPMFPIVICLAILTMFISGVLISPTVRQLRKRLQFGGNRSIFEKVINKGKLA